MPKDTPDNRFAQQLKKGVLEMLVLSLLAESPSHGYGLLLRLKQKSGDLLVLKEGTLYPILYRLEDSGCIQADWQAPAAQTEAYRSVPRKVYAITAAGSAVLAEQAQTWRTFAKCVDNFLGGSQS